MAPGRRKKKLRVAMPTPTTPTTRACHLSGLGLPQRSSLRRAIRESLLDVAGSGGSNSTTVPTTTTEGGTKSSAARRAAAAAAASSLSSPSSSSCCGSSSSALPVHMTATALSLGISSAATDRPAEGQSGNGIIPASRTRTRTRNRSRSRSNGGGRGRGWHRVREIVHEVGGNSAAGRKKVYLVEWEGRDPRTGAAWPSSWVNATDVSAAAIREWEARNAGRKDDGV
ncbi:hypothetical protein F4775DRAFT_414402 [Biscogniauxia sp. FL1348]|nr:hypothetical protein F4775DRAFT_414402 [Biscogniauxia sp. FL1348]